MSKFDDLEKRFESVVDKYLSSFPKENKSVEALTKRLMYYNTKKTEIDIDFHAHINDFKNQNNISTKDEKLLDDLKEKYENILIYGY